AAARVTLVNGQTSLDQSFHWGYDDASWYNMVRGRTEDNGWADFKALNFDSATVLVQAPGYARQKLGWRNQQNELTITLAPESVLAGEVRDAAGQPVQKFYAHLTCDSDRLGKPVRPEDNGRFRLTEVPAGMWTLTIYGSDGQSELYQGQVELKEGQTKDLKITSKK